jgi:hypothetical protein
VRLLLLHGDPQVGERPVREPVEVQQEVVEVDPLGPTRRAGGPDLGAGAILLERAEGLVVVFGPGAVQAAPDLPDERRIDPPDRVELGLGRGRTGRRAVGLQVDVGVGRARRVLERFERLARDLLHDGAERPGVAPVRGRDLLRGR